MIELVFVLCGWAVDCLSPNCSGHGVCVAGQCLCYIGYHGSDCSLPTTHLADANGSVLCVRDCSQHGVFNFDTQTCVCQAGWTGRSCETGSSSPPFTYLFITVLVLFVWRFVYKSLSFLIFSSSLLSLFCIKCYVFMWFLKLYFVTS